MDLEFWTDIPGWEGLYQASIWGRVRSIDRIVQHRKNGPTLYRGKVLTAKASDKGYLVVVLSRGGKTITKNVHSLVTQTFLGPLPEGQYVCHENGRRDDPALWNLRHDTPSGNALDMHRHGTGRNQYGAWK